MRVNYGMMCTDDNCREQYEVKCTYEELQEILKTAKCQTCDKPLRRSYSVGGIKFNGTGWGGGGKMI